MFKRKPENSRIADYELPLSEVRDRLTGPLGKMFAAHKGRPVQKWVDYLAAYERHFAPYRGINDLVFLEIGVAKGGSLELWREYFGPKATICGIDIDPECANRVDAPNLVRIGSQDDPDFLRSVVAEIGQPHIILDDGSHVATHQRVSFETLFPLLREGGLYAVEDMHTAYWRWFEGGHRRRGTAVEMVKDLIDTANGWWHHERTLMDKTEIVGVHAYDSIAFIDKGLKQRPANVTAP